MRVRGCMGRALFLSGSLAALACSSRSESAQDPSALDTGVHTAGEAAVGDVARDRDTGAPKAPEDAGSTFAAPEGDAGPCAVASTEVGLLPVHLAFAFDVSGSMGKGDKDWHDKTLKWDPVVRATRGFFEDQASKGLSASLTFFPSDGDEDERCDAQRYEEPDVPMTALPSAAFYSAIQAIEPKTSDDWRGGTPTLFVMQGTRSFLQRQTQQQRGKYAIVLVTDGYPQGCDDAADSVEAVVQEARAAAEQGVSTYVIGVANPPFSGAPDTVSDLEKIAVAGRTEHTYLIETGNETATVDALRSAVGAIREAAVSCTVAIPSAQAGRAFDKRKVAVALKGGTRDELLNYDSSCMASSAWHYDDPADPHEIALCPDVCARVQSEAKLRIEVQFACESLILL